MEVFTANLDVRIRGDWLVCAWIILQNASYFSETYMNANESMAVRLRASTAVHYWSGTSFVTDEIMAHC
jgi:hypothetical protein